MTENKPVAWLYDEPGYGWNIYSKTDPSGKAWRTNVRPLYEHPPAPQQPVTDPEVEAARRKALRAIFVALANNADASDWMPVTLERAVLRDLVGEPRRDGIPVPLYDAAYDKTVPTPALKTSATLHETRINTADIAPPARLSVQMLIQVIANAADRPDFGNLIMYGRIATAVHEAIYGRAGDCGGPVGVSGAAGPVGQTGSQGARNDQDHDDDGNRPDASFAGQAPWFR